MQAYRTGTRRFFLFRGRRRATVLAVASTIVVCAALGAYGMRSFSPRLRVTGLGDGGVVGRAEAKHLQLTVAAEDRSDLRRMKVTLDGGPVAAQQAGGRIVLNLPKLSDGEHELSLQPTGGGALDGTTRSFTVDTHGPRCTWPR